MMAFAAGAAGAVGKVPTRAEYLPVPTHAPSFAAFDAWLSQATDTALARTGATWPPAFASGAMHGFFYHWAADEPDAALCGAIAPSRDSAGRQFPLALALPLRVSAALAGRPELLPLNLEEVWASATAGLAELLDVGDPAKVTPGFGPSLAADVQESDELYREWTSTLPLEELWALLGMGARDPAATLRLLFATVSPLRGRERPATTLSLRVPLGAAGGPAVCAWLDFLRRSLGWRSTLPSFFWSHDGKDGAALLHLGSPPKITLAELWLPTGAQDEIADLTAPVSPALMEALAPLPAPISGVLATPRATLADLLAAL